MAKATTTKAATPAAKRTTKVPAPAATPAVPVEDKTAESAGESAPAETPAINEPAAPAPAEAVQDAAPEHKDASESVAGDESPATTEDLANQEPEIEKPVTELSEKHQALAARYKKLYPHEKGIAVTTDGQVFLKGNTHLAKEHQARLGKGALIEISL